MDWQKRIEQQNHVISDLNFRANRAERRARRLTEEIERLEESVIAHARAADEASHSKRGATIEARSQGRAAEREAVVRYLRKQAQLYPSNRVRDALLEVSDEIARGDHATLHHATLQEEPR